MGALPNTPSAFVMRPMCSRPWPIVRPSASACSRGGGASGERDAFSPERVASVVLGFIEQRLHSVAAAGADPAKLQTLMARARDGGKRSLAAVFCTTPARGGAEGAAAYARRARC
jgi:hypothetical protein